MATEQQSNWDYLNIRDYVSSQTTERVILSTRIFKINKRDKKQARIFLLTDNAIYNIKSTKNENCTVQMKNNSIVCQRCICLTKLESIIISAETSQFILNIPLEYDYRYEAFTIYHRNAIITAIHNALSNKVSTMPTIHNINSFDSFTYSIVKKNDNKLTASIKRKFVNEQPTIPWSNFINNKQHLSSTNETIKKDLANEPKYNKNRISKWNKIQIEPKSMSADEYHEILIHGFSRNVERLLGGKIIPEEIKSLCIAFYYKFLKYNEYCDVRFKNEFCAQKLLIKTALNEMNFKRPFGCKLISRLPINSYNNGYGKVQIKVILNETQPETFQCVALSDYDAVVPDGMNLVRDDIYEIIKICESGWWYGLHENVSNIDQGWVPSTYLKRINENTYSVGIITDTELFMNASHTENPFKGKHVQHAICRMSEGILEVTDGEDNISLSSSNGIEKELLINIWIEFDKLRIYKKNVSNGFATWFSKDLLKDIDGNVVDYYFAMTFGTRDIVRYEISGDFI